MQNHAFLYLIGFAFLFALLLFKAVIKHVLCGILGKCFRCCKKILKIQASNYAGNYYLEIPFYVLRREYAKTEREVKTLRKIIENCNFLEERKLLYNEMILTQ